MSAALITLEPTVEVRRLPLWKNLLDEMQREGLAENKVYPIEHFTKGIGASLDSLELVFGIAEITKALRRLGWVLTSRGQKGTQYVLLPHERNADEMVRLNNVARRALREAVVLGNATPLDKLTDEQRRRHEAVLEKTATRHALLARAQKAIK